MNRSKLKRNLLMLKMESLAFTWKFWAARAGLFVVCLLAAVVTMSGSGWAQDFTLTMAPFSTDSVGPGGEASSTITLGTLNGFSGTVDLTCQVAPQQTTATPVCELTPGSVAPPGSATATVTTTGLTPPGLYTITVTGTASGTTNSHPGQQNLTVLAVTPQFTITVAQSVVPSSVHAGSGGTGTISVNPLNGYSGSVTLGCASITPLVTIPPECSFNPQTVTVTGTVATSTLSISTTGPPVPAAVANAGAGYALWLSVPMLALATIGMAGRKRPRRAWCLLALFVLGGALLLVPACGNNSTTTTTTTTTGVTPNNSYTFTLRGVDANGASSSNTGTAPTVTLTVD